MSLEYIEHEGNSVLYLDLENVAEPSAKMEHVRSLNLLISNSSKADFLVLVNLRNFMPCKGFMEYATSTLIDRAPKIRKAAYFGLGRRNQKLFEYFDHFNHSLVDREIFDSRESALEWLTARTREEV